MTIEIIGNNNIHRLYCTGSFTKLLTTYVCLSRLAEQYQLETILDDDHFLDKLCVNDASRGFLTIFQNVIGNRFTIRDICTFYAGLPYTFDISQTELDEVENGKPLKHHSISDERTFLSHCKHHITRVNKRQCKFHYSELSIIFLGYLIEKVFMTTIEELYQKYIIEACDISESLFSRTLPSTVYKQDLSMQYDYPAVAIMDHGYFCYSNSFFTTLHDEKIIVEHILTMPVFHVMGDITKARAASNTIMNGMTVEIRKVDDDIIYGYEGLSYSGCNIWAYSTKHKKGYLTFTNDEDAAYPLLYGKFGYEDFDKVPDHTQSLYQYCLANCEDHSKAKAVPDEFVGQYKRVDINDSQLNLIFNVTQHTISIRNPYPVTYDVVYDDGIYRTASKDHLKGIKIGFHRTSNGHAYMSFDGTLYRKIL